MHLPPPSPHCVPTFTSTPYPRYKRSSRLSGPGTAASVTSVGQLSPEEKAARAATAAAETARYEQLKVEFQGWTLGLGLLGGLSCYYLYGSDVAISYALGSVAALIYLRLLTRSVDAGEGVDVCLGWMRRFKRFAQPGTARHSQAQPGTARHSQAQEHRGIGGVQGDGGCMCVLAGGLLGGGKRGALSNSGVHCRGQDGGR
jgi:hypothetical protein